MKKLFFLSLALVGFCFTSEAQTINENAIGLRLGGYEGLGSEISYQRALKSNNRLEIDLGLYRSGFKATGLYQWVWVLDGDINWYAGVGGSFSSFSSEGFISAAGNIGIEYNFNEIPLQLSLDTRPELGFGDFNTGLGFYTGLGVRYVF